MDGWILLGVGITRKPPRSDTLVVTTVMVRMEVVISEASVLPTVEAQR